MQGCPQSKSKKLNPFASKISLKAIMNFVKTKKPKLNFFILKRTIQKKSDLFLNNSKENACFVTERHSKQETNP